MIKYIRMSFIALSLTALFISCSDDPTSLGEDLVPDQDKVKFAEYDTYVNDTPQKSYTYLHKLKLGDSEKVLLGKTSYGESSAIYKYWINEVPDSILARILKDEVVITSAKMLMKTSYTQADPGNYFDFSVHQIRSKWSPVGFDSDSLKILKYDALDVSSTKTLTDTSIAFDLKPSVVAEWLKFRKDTNQVRNYGLLYKPKAGTNKMVGFNEVNLEGKSTNIQLTFIYERPATKFKDTITVAPFWDVNAYTSTKPISENNLFAQGGLGLRSVLSFDFSKVPKNIILNKATLELSVDDVKTKDGLPKSDSLVVYAFADSAKKKLNEDSIYYSYLSRKNNIYTGDLSLYAQKWIKGEANQGIMISLPDEMYSSARIALYSSKESNKALRPRLKLIYTVK